MEKEDASRVQYPAGIKWTRQRKCVYGILYRSMEPLSAIQIYQQVLQTEKAENYAVSTIYRILGAFEDHGLVSRDVWPEDGTVFYELNRGEHTHYAVCLECRKRIPLSGCPFIHMRLDTGAKDFMVTGHRVELYGYCKDCQELHRRTTGRENF